MKFIDMVDELRDMDEDRELWLWHGTPYTDEAYIAAHQHEWCFPFIQAINGDIVAEWVAGSDWEVCSAPRPSKLFPHSVAVTEDFCFLYATHNQ